MKCRQRSRDRKHFLENTARGIRINLLIWPVVLLVAGVGSAQTTPSQSPSAQPKPTLAQTGPAQPTPVQIESGRATPTQTPASRVFPGTTNAPPGQVGELLQVRPRRSVLEGGPDLSFNAPKANEVTSGQHTYSGILVQVIKAKHPLHLLNPAAPSQYGSGWDNIEWFPASANGPRLKLFSLSF